MDGPWLRCVLYRVLFQFKIFTVLFEVIKQWKLPELEHTAGALPPPHTNTSTGVFTVNHTGSYCCILREWKIWMMWTRWGLSERYESLGWSHMPYLGAEWIGTSTVYLLHNEAETPNREFNFKVEFQLEVRVNFKAGLMWPHLRS